MFRPTLGLTLSAVLIAAPTPAAAQSRKAVTQQCRDAVVARGHEGYAFKREEYTVARSGGASLTGQIVRGGDRFEFNCVVDAGQVRDVSINRLSGGRGPSQATGAASAAAARPARRQPEATDGPARRVSRAAGGRAPAASHAPR